MKGEGFSSQQQIVRRNRLFVLIPTVLLIILVAALAWEILHPDY
jgi:hypothetical protein